VFSAVSVIDSTFVWFADGRAVSSSIEEPPRITNGALRVRTACWCPNNGEDGTKDEAMEEERRRRAVIKRK
jgi:hypothetical protein